MGDFDFDKIEGHFRRKEKRLSEFSHYLDVYKSKHFSKTGEEIEIVEDAAALITNLYFEWLEKHVKPFVPKRINKYKISSLAELCIVKIQPFYFKDVNTSRKLNADFAFFCTICFVLSLSGDVENFNKFSGHKLVEDVFNTAKTQRIQWLEAKNPNSFPVFSNGLSLFLLFSLYDLRFQALAN